MKGSWKTSRRTRVPANKGNKIIIIIIIKWLVDILKTL